MAKWIIGIVVVLAVLIGIRIGISYSGPSDDQLIQDALDEAIAAGSSGEPGPVLDFISRSIEFNGMVQVDRREIADYIKRFEPEVEVLDREVVVEGDTARMTSPVKFRVGAGPISVDQTIERVEIDFEKEQATKWLVFPTKKWRVVRVSAPGWTPGNYAP